MFRFTFDAIGTAWVIETPSLLEMPARRRILERIEKFDATYSRFRPDSLVSRIASSAEGRCFTFPEDSRKLFMIGCVPAQRARLIRWLGYSATEQYGGQPSFITVKAALANGVITSVEVTPHATVPRSLDLQRRFAAAVPRVVIGKPIDQIDVGKLNAAIRQIREQASR